MKPRICHITDNLRPGVGVSAVTLELVSEFEAAVLHIGNDEVDPAFGDISRAQGTRAIVEALWHFKRAGYRILHVHSRRADTACLIGKALGFKTVRTHHIVYPEQLSSLNIAAQFRNRLSGRTFWIDRWVAVSKTARRYIEHRWQIPSSRITVVYNGVDTEKFSPPSASERQKLRRTLGWADDWKVCLSVGTLTNHKRPLEVIAAFAAVTDPLVRLVIVGEGSLRSQVEAAARSSDRILLLGPRGDVPDLMKAADILIHAATGEAFGLVVAEALSSGLPAVVMGGQGPAEIIEDGRTGVVVFSDDISALSSGIARTLQGAVNMRRAARAASGRFSKHKMLSRYREIYSELLDPERRQEDRSKPNIPQ
jgi:glycosyltransferase involved in cell wall biosynthesis